MLALSVCECQLAEEYVPTYQYACTVCNHRFDAVQSFSDPSLTECPKCSGKLRKVFSSVGIVFKGSGFYRTDSREAAKSASGSSSSSSSEKSSEKSSDKGSEKSSEKSSDSSSSSSSSSDKSGGTKDKSSGSSSSTPAAAASK